MKRAVRSFVSVLTTVALACGLSGCWDIKSVQDVNYFTGIGIDYKDEQYVIYVQQLDFSSVAKAEGGGGGKSDKPAKSWIGHAKGKSLSAAVMELYRTSQQTVFWGHLSTVVISESLLKSNKLLEVFDALTRSPEIRMTPWIFGTNEPMSDVFSTLAFFFLSPLNTILYAPESSFKQKSAIVPMRMYRFVRETRDPGCTVLLPSLGVSSDTWEVNRKPDAKLEMTGVYALLNERYKNWYSLEQMQGVKWMSKYNRTSRLLLEREGKPLATLRIGNPKAKIKIVPGASDDLQVTFSIKMRAEMLELWQEAGERELEQAAVDHVRADIEKSMKESMKSRSDLYNIEHELYRKHYKIWKRLTHNGQVAFEYGKIPELKIDVQISDSGMYKLNRKFSPYD
ncbi:Ger(x)C family spore germination protein [Cohnella sp. GCM10027633]|uniref:Ger(x)C family spore germination protein n=1 Tax=unclassified Cohnella TaxID=2636738 RepID=UPI0036282356